MMLFQGSRSRALYKERAVCLHLDYLMPYFSCFEHFFAIASPVWNFFLTTFCQGVDMGGKKKKDIFFVVSGRNFKTVRNSFVFTTL